MDSGAEALIFRREVPRPEGRGFYRSAALRHALRENASAFDCAQARHFDCALE